MFQEDNLLLNILNRVVLVVGVAVMLASCVTETTESSSSIKFTDTAVVSVQNPNVAIMAGSTFSWLPQGVRFYQDERLEKAPIKPIIEDEILGNLKAKKMTMVESVSGARYAIAYTAALASSLDDEAIIRRYGLLPGNSQVPKDDTNVEKGSLIIYVFNNKTDEVIWRSAAQVGVHFDMPMNERKQRIARVVAEMFQTFPAR